MKARRILLGGLGVAVLLSILITMMVPRKQIKRAWLIVRGKLVDVGGYRLRVECKGRGEPAVVMDAGLAHGLHTWDLVLPEVAKFTRVCSYDRAGIGESDRGRKPRTSQQIVTELHALLKNVKLKAPYVLVGHSFGGLNVRLYASQHPDQVAGMVLVDPSHEDQSDRYAALMSRSVRQSFLDLENGRNKEDVNVLVSDAQLRSSTPIPNIPLVVLTAAYAKWLPRSKQIEQVRQELQSDLAHLVPNSSHLIATRSGHFIQQDRPDLVIHAIQTVVVEVRNRSVAQKDFSQTR
jgi:pimeloyl-ACP methyl ester carboxylesterase